MKHTLRTTLIGVLSGATLASLPAFAQMAPNTPAGNPGAVEPELGFGIFRDGDQVSRAYGRLAAGATPADSAQAFIAANAQRLWGVDPASLAAYGPFEGGEHVVQIMPDRDAGGFKFTGLYYTQTVKGIPVYKANLLVLTRNETGFPAVLASSTLWDVSDAEAMLAGKNLNALPAERVWTRNALSQFRAKPTVSPAQYVVWAGIDRVKAEPRLAVLFTAEGGGHWDPENHQRIEFVVDAENGAILHQESKIYHAVTGRVTGVATQGVGADTCNPEAAAGLPYLRVQTGSTTAFTDVNGDFTIAAGAPGATYSTSLVGRYFTTTNNGAATLSLSTTANDGANWSPVFNAANTAETDRAQVNAYLQSNIIRDVVVAASPNFPTVSTQLSSFQINTNLANTCNAYYTGDTINFYLAGGGCANTAFGDVVHHEYGHNVVAKGGSGQGAYGEGMGDIHGILVTDDPRTGLGFQNCTTGIRTAANTCTYSATGCSSCGSAIHSCGQLISGCVWDLRTRLRTAYPSTYRTILADLAVNSVLLHGAVTTINADITVDFLTLDDDNGDIQDGTPNYTLINDAFTVHGLPGPALQAVRFSYPNGLPVVAAPAGGTQIQVRIDPVAGTPNPTTAKLFAKVGAASTFTEYPLSASGGNAYVATLPGGECPTAVSYYLSVQSTSGATVTSPSAGTAAPYSAVLAASITDVADLTFESGAPGWSVGAAGDTATTGLWTRVDPIGTAAQPENDHTPDPGVLAWITGQGTVGGALGEQDVDGGATTLVSPAYDCTGLDVAYVSYWRWYSNNSGSAPNADNMPIEISGDNGATWVLLENVTENAAAWVQKTFRVSDFVTPSAQVRVRFRAQDTGTGSIVEAGIDDFRVYGAICPAARPTDLNGDGRVDGADLGILLGSWGTAANDLNGDGQVDGADLGVLLGDWG
jgi:hypothetical protein